MNKLIIFISLIVFSLNFNGQENVDFNIDNFPGQEKEFKEITKKMTLADEYFKQKKFMQALELYLIADNFNSYNSLLNLKIAKCYIETTRPKGFDSYARKAITLDPNVNPYAYFILGESFQLKMNFEEAIKEYKKYDSLLPLDKREKNKSTIDKKIEECKTGLLLIENPINVNIENLGSNINSKYEDYSPIISSDETELYYTTRRNTTTGGAICIKDNDYYEDINKSTRETKGEKWIISNNVGFPLNTKTNDATIALSTDAQKMIIYKDVNGGDIFESKLIGDQWQMPKPFPSTINTKYHESFACFSHNGTRLYFVSDKPDGSYGGKDIYYCVKNDRGEWGEPVNLGPIVNTKHDEAGVFMHPDEKTLFFSSKGHNTIGGFDIFKTQYDEETGLWSKPENLGYPINTPDDDVFVVVSPDGKRLYYSSANLEGFGGKDIYVITLLDYEDVIINTEDNLISSSGETFRSNQLKSIINEAEVTIFTGRLLDPITKLPINKVGTIQVADNEMQKIIAILETNIVSGKFTVALPSGKNYGITIKVDDYLFHSENFDIPKGTKYKKITKDIVVQPIEKGSKIVLNNIFFDFDKYSLRSESYLEIENVVELLKKYPNMVVELSGYTDNLGSDEYNQKLSENRAKAVFDVLVYKKGISAKRLNYVGYGESNPIAPNENADGSDNPENRQLNRRTEFKIVSM